MNKIELEAKIQEIICTDVILCSRGHYTDLCSLDDEVCPRVKHSVSRLLALFDDRKLPEEKSELLQNFCRHRHPVCTIPKCTDCEQIYNLTSLLFDGMVQLAEDQTPPANPYTRENYVYVLPERAEAIYSTLQNKEFLAYGFDVGVDKMRIPNAKWEVWMKVIPKEDK